MLIKKSLISLDSYSSNLDLWCDFFIWFYLFVFFCFTQIEGIISHIMADK